MEVKVIRVEGLDIACEAVRLSFNSESDEGAVEKSQGVSLWNDNVELAKKLILSGDSHSKCMRMATVWLDLTMPRYWWSEADQCKVGFVTMSESTSHKITASPFTMDMFECSNMDGYVSKKSHFENPIDESTEVWKSHPKYSHISVSSQGRVKRRAYTTSHGRSMPEKLLSNIVKGDDYLGTSILLDEADPSSRKLYPTHRLVAETFIENPNGKKEVNHINGNKRDNSVENLEWVTRQENEEHVYSTGIRYMCNSLAAQKTSHANLRFGLDDVGKIRAEFLTGEYSMRALGLKWGCHNSIISDIVDGSYGNKVKLTTYEFFKGIVEELELTRLRLVEEVGVSEATVLLKQMLPESFLQRRIVCTNYQTLRHIYFDRRNHRLPIWHTFLDELMKQLPFPEFVTIEKGVTK